MRRFRKVRLTVGPPGIAGRGAPSRPLLGAGCSARRTHNVMFDWARRGAVLFSPFISNNAHEIEVYVIAEQLAA
jgi:hypothetical protein